MRKSYILAVLVCGLGLMVYVGLLRPHTTVPSDQTAIAVRVVTLSRQDVPVTLGGPGTVYALHGATGTTPVAAEFSLPASALAQLQQLVQNTQDPPVQAYTTALPPSLLAEGHLTLIDNEQASTTVLVKAEFENTQRTLHAGTAVNLHIQTGVMRQVLAVPANVIQPNNGQPFVYRVEGQTIASVPVKVIYHAVMDEVIEGVNEGDTLVVDGPGTLKPGVRIQIIAP